MRDQDKSKAQLVTELAELRRQLAEAQALKDEKRQYHKIFEQGPLAICIVDSNLRYTTVNDKMCDFTGYDRDELIGQAISQITSPEDIELDQDLTQQVFSEILPLYQIEKRYIRKDGKVVWGKLTVMVVCDEDRQPLYGLRLIEDITNYKEAEDALRNHAAELERSNRELENFAYVASHDLQEPLRKIRTFSGRLQTKYRNQLDDRGQDYLSRMEHAASRMQILINDLLSFSQATSQNRLSVEVDLNLIVTEVLLDLETHIEEVSAQIEVAELPTIEADSTQMRQLMQNLISNAIKFHREGEVPVVKISSRVFKERRQNGLIPLNSQLCQIIIEDNGIGFDNKYADRIFAVFQRLHGHAQFKGTGVGLAICRKIVEHHKGHVTAQSSPGQGATFIITLPLKQTSSE